MSHDFYFHFGTTTVFPLWLRMSQLPVAKLGYGQTQTSGENVEKTIVCNSYIDLYMFLHLTYKKYSWPYYYNYVLKCIL